MTAAISHDYEPLFPGSVWYESLFPGIKCLVIIFPRQDKCCTEWNCPVSHKTIEKKNFVSFPLQKHSYNFWLAFIIPQHHQLRKSMLGSAEPSGLGVAESRVQMFSKHVDRVSSPMEGFTSSATLKWG